MNYESIDDLYHRWKQNPDVDETTALCEALRGGKRPELVDIVGSHASRQADVGALLAAARMYTDSARLDEAQSVLIAAGRIAPREGNVYRWLGEVLLRRGDAERAEKVLDKAIQFGGDSASKPLLERARTLVATQRASGQAAVAEAMRSAIPPPLPSAPPSSRRPPPVSERALGKPRPPPSARSLPARRDEEEETAVRSSDPVKDAIESALAGSLSSHVGTSPAPSRPPPPLPRPPASVPPPPLRYNAPLPGKNLVFTGPTRDIGFDLPPTSAPPPSAPPSSLGNRSDPKVASAATAAFGSSHNRIPKANEPGAPRNRQVEPAVNPMLLQGLARPQAVANGPVPEPRDVLDALQMAGVYEPDTVGASHAEAWAKPVRSRRYLSMGVLGSLALLLVAGGIGTYKIVVNQRAAAHIESEALLLEVDRDLHASEASRLDGIETRLAKSFEMESRSPHTALTWLRERALVGLLKSGADIAFEDSTQRAKAVGVEEKRIAFAMVASFLFQGDTAGAAATVAKWDATATDDAWFQLIAGATFERAGDARSLERYATAVKLDPDLVIAQILLTRATAVEGDARRAAELAKEFRTRYPTRIEGAALVALIWTRDPLRGEPPPEVKEITEKPDALPPALRAVPFAARAILSLHKGAFDEARPSIQKGLDVVDTPGVAAWLGNIALIMGDDALARKAALTAVSFSAVYPPARVLAARVALLGARLDEAIKATEDLPPSSPDVAIVTAAVSYEKLDTEHLARALEAMGDDAKKQPFALPLARGQALLAGNLGVLTSEKAFEMADDEAPWSDLVAMDWALDSGDLENAKKIAERWRGETRPMHAIRLSRLARYDGRLEDAERFSRAALQSSTVTMRVLSERIFTLVAEKKDTDALALFKSYPNVGGPLAKWLRAYVTAVHGKVEEARGMVSQEDPPPSTAPVPARIIAACAFAAMKDMRHGPEYTRPIVMAGFANPDVGFATEKLGLGKIVRRAR